MGIRENVYKEAVSLLERDNRIGLELTTGTGKTKIALDLINESGEEWDICCPTTDIVQSWYDEIDKWGLQHLKSKLRVYCYQSLHKYISHDRGINFCLDEAHNITDKRRDFLLLGLKPHSKLIALSATIDYEKRGLLAEIGVRPDSYIRVKTDDAVKAGIITDYEMYVYKVELENTPVMLPRFKKPISEKSAYNFLTRAINKARGEGKWDTVTFMSIWRKQLLSGLKSKEKVAEVFINRVPEDRRALIFAANIEQSDRLCENSYHSKSDKDLLERFNRDEFNIMSSVAKIREGINAKADIIIKTSIDSKEKNLAQELGRGLRLNPNKPDKKAIAIILVAEGTQEEVWMENSTESFKNLKIKRWGR